PERRGRHRRGEEGGGAETPAPQYRPLSRPPGGGDRPVHFGVGTGEERHTHRRWPAVLAAQPGQQVTEAVLAAVGIAKVDPGAPARVAGTGRDLGGDLVAGRARGPGGGEHESGDFRRQGQPMRGGGTTRPGGAGSGGRARRAAVIFSTHNSASYRDWSATPRTIGMRTDICG